ncbi:MAG TPA: Hsp20/alpha crystallin family protein [Caulobacteraceae bacterium]|jgi:HSP20 family protein|nr:Hsp20/alpha crystallin family protein [Caulobacteraceae bacterium]
MTEANPQTSDQKADNGRSEARDRRGGRQPAPGDRPPAERSFGGEGATADRADIPVRQAVETGLQIPHEAVQAGQEILRAGQRAAVETSEMWRQSLEPLVTMQSEMNHWFDDVWRRMTGLGAMRPMQTARPFAGGGVMALMGAPAADLKETETAYRLCVEVPGLAPENLEVGVKGDVLIVSGQKTEDRHEAADAYQISERRYGSFERTFPVPQDVDRSHIDAKLESGLLKVTLPKKAQAAAPLSKIEVHA